MREILFRGKRIDNGEWVYGSLILNNNHPALIYDCNTHNNFNGDEVIPETVGQYTGINDGAGNKIFEDDIARSSNCLPEDIGDYVIKFENGSFHLFWTTGNWHCGFSQEEIDALNLEVIGNIHEPISQQLT